MVEARELLPKIDVGAAGAVAIGHIGVGADQKVGEPILIEIADARNRPSDVVEVVLGRELHARRAQRGEGDGSSGGLAAINQIGGPAIAVERSTDQDIVVTVAVDVADARDGPARPVEPDLSVDVKSAGTEGIQVHVAGGIASEHDGREARV